MHVCVCVYVHLGHQNPCFQLNYNLCYSPPELIMGQVLDAHDWTVDSWHAGCMMAGMVKGEPLVFGDCGIGQLMQVFRCCSLYSLRIRICLQR